MKTPATITPKHIYIAGPMTGLPGYNYAAFNHAAAHLRALGHTVENPAENPVPPCQSWAGYMRLGLRQLTHCDTIALLPNWPDSRGAQIEYALAVQLDYHITTVAELLGTDTLDHAAP